MSIFFVSFIVIARNAQAYLPNIFNDILNQDYPKDKLELILVDGQSKDKTLEIMNNFKNMHNDLKIKVLNNPMRILSSGWNIALSNSVGDIILRVDANSRVPSNFVKKNVETIIKGHDIVGGETSTNRGNNQKLNLIILAELSKFGGSPASFRNSGKARYVNTLAYASYKKSIFETIGGYDERLIRNQDNEIHYRMRKAGFKFYYNPEIKSSHVSRVNLRALLKQKYSNGLWIGLTMGIQPRCFNLRHFMPLFFLIAVIICILLGIIYADWSFFIALIVIYLIPALFFSFKSMQISKPNAKIRCLALPSLFFLMHFTYGLGTIIGLTKMPYFVWKNRNYNIPFPFGAKK